MIQKILQMNKAVLVILMVVISLPILANQEKAKEVMPSIIMLLLGEEDFENGKIIDACVSNLSYKTSSGVTGRTNSKCEFNYREGDSIEFFIGGQSLGVIEANDYILAYDMANFSQTATLLQSIDSDGVPSNGIQVGTLVDKALESLSYTISDVDPNDSGFRSQFRTLTGREFVADIEKSVQHSINSPKAEWIKQTSLSDYYLGESKLLGCFTTQPCNENFLLGNDIGSSLQRLEHYFWSHQVAPLMFLQERLMVDDSFKISEQRARIEKEANHIANTFSAVLAVVAEPSDVKKAITKEVFGRDGKAVDLSIDITEELIKDYLVDQGHLYSAGAVDGLVSAGKAFKDCAKLKISAKCLGSFSSEVFNVMLDFREGWLVHQNQEKVNAYSAALDFLTAVFNSGGKYQFIQTQPVYGFSSNFDELSDFFIDGRDIDIVVFDNVIMEAFNAVDKRVSDMKVTGLLDPYPEGDLGLIEIKVTESFIDPTTNSFGFCYEVENLSHDRVAISGDVFIEKEGGISADQRQMISDASRSNGNLILNNLGDKYQDCEFVDLSSDTQSQIFVITIETDYERSGNTYNQNTSSASYQQSFEVGINERLELDSTPFKFSLANKEQTVSPDQTVNLAAIFSVEKVGTTYQWKITSPSGITLNNATNKEASFVAPQITLGENNQYVKGIFRATAPSGETELKSFSVNVVSDNANLPQPPTGFSATPNFPSLSIDFNWLPVSPISGAIYNVYLALDQDVTPSNYTTKLEGQRHQTTASSININLIESGTYYAVITEKLGDTESTYRTRIKIPLTQAPAPPGSTGLLNDTGINFGGDYPSGNNTTCTNNMFIGSGPNSGDMLQQDCDTGRDATHNDNSDGAAGFSFTKLNASGGDVPASAATWSCVRDNVTSLIWEKKTDDGSEHDKDNAYRWGGTSAYGLGHPNAEGEYYDDWNTLLNHANSSGLCGYSDWRLPTPQELFSITHLGTSFPVIDTFYFPNTVSFVYWSSSPSAMENSAAWGVHFFDGGVSDAVSRNSINSVRLVR